MFVFTIFRIFLKYNWLLQGIHNLLYFTNVVMQLAQGAAAGIIGFKPKPLHSRRHQEVTTIPLSVLWLGYIYPVPLAVAGLSLCHFLSL